MKTYKQILFLSLIFIQPIFLIAQKSQSPLTDSIFAGLKFRSIGPALMSGRIADIAIHPENNSIWYVAVGSGGVWKTVNSGTTWQPIFDDQKSYSIGCITIDPNNPNIIWVGTGENVGGRHVGYGDGVYKSEDGGESWKNLGLGKSEHISKIIIHPENSDIVWVAAQGPLWSSGGERGLYKSTDAGKTWKKTLGDDKWVGVTDIVLDPRDSDRIYAATWERHRNVAAYIGGGPGTALYRSDDGGIKWNKLTKGLPNSDMGKIGLAISPQKPDVVYAAIELDRRKGGVYRSTNRGASWTKMSNAVAGATGPHYYQELYASPHKFDRLYLVDVRMQVSENGGKTFKRMKEKHKHSDNHSIAFRKDDPNYLLVGTDGGIYESFDLTENWKFIANLPVTQYYKVAVDDAEPFYTIYGGTQDNNTQGGPSRTDNVHGIRNSDWFITLFGDGHQPATEPGNPDIMYSEAQEGWLFRVDRTTGEQVFIQPQPEEGEGFERYNWDAPILVSPHSPKRIYYASQRVWKSDDRGDNWKAISNDLTRNQERIELPVDGKTWSWDSPWDIYAMSTYNTITSLAESPVKEGILYAGTDDGLIHVTEDGGQNWKRMEIEDLPGVPKTAFVNDIKADLFNESTVYVVLDNHKFGDYSPYILKSTDKGKSWKSIRSNLPDRTLTWRIVQDHVKSGLLFVATEFGIYFTINSGTNWVKLKGGVPTISFRDLAIQRRENDLVGASFGRGFYVLDDYSVLRNVSEEQLKKEAKLFPSRKAWWYFQRKVVYTTEKGSQGAGFFTAPNPPFGAVFTYYLSKEYKTLEEERIEKEKDLRKKNVGIKFPGWDEVEKERRQDKPRIVLTIKDKDNKVVRKLIHPAKTGFNRVAWDLRYASRDAIKMENLSIKKTGILVNPGVYTASLAKNIDGIVTHLDGPVSFEVERLYEGALESADPTEVVNFWKEIEELVRELSASKIVLKKTTQKFTALREALNRSESVPGNLEKEYTLIREELFRVDEMINGNQSKNQVGEKNTPTINDRLRAASMGTLLSTYGPTPTHKRSLEIAKSEFVKIKAAIDKLTQVRIPELEKKIVDFGAPHVE